MTDVQRFRQSGYDNSLLPSSNDGDAHYMYYKDHAVIVSLLREQLDSKDAQIQTANEQNERLLRVIDRMLEEMRSR
jgi:hypothetical protein